MSTAAAAPKTKRVARSCNVTSTDGEIESMGSVALVGKNAVLILAGFWARRRRFSPVDAYLLGYFGILFLWPYDDPRFFAPVLPLLFALGWIGLRSFPIEARNLRRLAIAYSIVFCVFGTVAMSDSLYVTYFDRLEPWREISRYAPAVPDWVAAFDRYGGVRPHTGTADGESARTPR